MAETWRKTSPPLKISKKSRNLSVFTCGLVFSTEPVDKFCAKKFFITISWKLSVFTCCFVLKWQKHDEKLVPPWKFPKNSKFVSFHLWSRFLDGARRQILRGINFFDFFRKLPVFQVIILGNGRNMEKKFVRAWRLPKSPWSRFRRGAPKRSSNSARDQFFRKFWNFKNVNIGLGVCIMVFFHHLWPFGAVFHRPAPPPPRLYPENGGSKSAWSYLQIWSTDIARYPSDRTKITFLGTQTVKNPVPTTRIARKPQGLARKPVFRNPNLRGRKTYRSYLHRTRCGAAPGAALEPKFQKWHFLTQFSSLEAFHGVFWHCQTFLKVYKA